MLVVTPPSIDASDDASNDIFIRDTIHEILELVPTLPKLQKLSGMLRGREYDEGHDEDDDMVVDDEDGQPVSLVEILSLLVVLISFQKKHRRLTYHDARDMLQASDLEIARGLRDKRILILDGECRRAIRIHIT